ncbi:MAG: SRPBCC family protein [Candidatus Hadarchaeum sp.]
MLTIEVSDVIRAPKEKVFSYLNTPRKYLRFEQEMKAVKIDGDIVHVEIKIFGRKRNAIFKYKTNAPSEAEISLVDGEIGITRSWHRLLSLQDGRTRVIHGVQLDLNSWPWKILSRFLIKWINAHEHAEISALKRTVEKRAR